MQNINIYTSNRTIVFQMKNDEALLRAYVDKLAQQNPVVEEIESLAEVYISKEDAEILIHKFNIKYAKEKVGFLKKRATKKEIDFNLDFNDIFRMNNIDRCELTGIRLSKSNATGALKFNSSTLDRVDHNKGYVKGNVMVMCHAANKLKARYEDPNNSDYIELEPTQLLQLLRDHFQKNWSNNPEYYV